MSTKMRSASGLCLLMLACSSTPVTQPTPSTTDATDPPDGGPAAGCLLGTHEIAPGKCDADLRWSKGGALLPARNHHNAFAFKSARGPKVYAVGGVHDMMSRPVQIQSDVKVADIAEDGSLGPWLDARPLPSARYATGMALVDDVVVVTGGVSATAVLADTISARVEADGTLTEWKPGPRLPLARYHLTLSSHGGWVYAAGGAVVKGSALAAVSRVDRAPVAPDGTVGEWQTTDLPQPRSHHSAIVHGGALYLIGGGSLQPGDYYTDVIRAPFREDGSLGEWTKAADLAANIGTGPVVEYNGYLYLIGGIRGSKDDSRESVSTVRRAQFMSDGSLGPWEDAAKLPVPSGHVHDAPLVGNHLYYINGSDDMGTALEDVFVGTFE